LEHESGAALDQDADYVPPLCPRPVVVANVLVVEQFDEEELSDRRPLADTTVGDHVGRGADAVGGVQVTERRR